MSKCGWCGKVINGEPIMSIQEACLFISDANTIVEIIPEYGAYFCCNGCAWAFSVEVHRLMGFSSKDLRTHLISMHGFSYPPGKTAGGMRRDCLVVDIARSLASVFKA